MAKEKKKCRRYYVSETCIFFLSSFFQLKLLLPSSTANFTCFITFFLPFFTENLSLGIIAWQIWQINIEQIANKVAKGLEFSRFTPYTTHILIPESLVYSYVNDSLPRALSSLSFASHFQRAGCLVGFFDLQLGV